MVNLMLQPVFLNLVKGSTDHKMTSDDLYNMWSVASRAKSAIVQGRRLENLSWRLWYTSTIRSKIEMEEKRRKAEEVGGEKFVEEEDLGTFVETETEGESSTSTNSRKSKKRSSLVLPSDRPLFTSTCTSILAEIQDASFRFTTNSNYSTGFNINQSHFQTNISHSHGHSHHVHIVSPPINRSKSPGNSLSSNATTANSANFIPKRKKNVEKFLKKFKSNLEDISEQFDGFSDEEATEKNINNEHQMETSVKSLSPTASSKHFTTDEEGQFSSFYPKYEDDLGLIRVQKPQSIVKKAPSMISKLLKKEEELGFGSASPSIRNKNNVLFNEEHFINDQPELINTNNNRHNKNYEEDEPQRRIIDANALSSSLSASKFKLEDEFDSQLVIW